MKITSTVNFATMDLYANNAFDYRDFHLAWAKSLLISTYDDVVMLEYTSIHNRSIHNTLRSQKMPLPPLIS